METVEIQLRELDEAIVRVRAKIMRLERGWLHSLCARVFGLSDMVILDPRAPIPTVSIDAWGRRGRVLNYGDAVPHLDHLSTYSVRARESHVRADRMKPDDLWVNVDSGKIASWSVHSCMGASFDVTGKRIGRGWR